MAKGIAAFSGILLGLLIFAICLNYGILKKNHQALIVMSGSMEPAIKTESLIFTQSETTYKVGDVITYQRSNPNDLVSHRIAARTHDGYITKGDANKDPDPIEVRKEQVVGKVFLVVPYAGKLAGITKHPEGFIAVVIVPATILVYEELKKIANEAKNSVKKLVANKRRKPLPVWTAFVPLVGIILAFSISTGALFSDKEQSSTNILKAADVFPTPTPSATPAITPAQEAGSSGQLNL
jgi:signal peptidase